VSTKSIGIRAGGNALGNVSRTLLDTVDCLSKLTISEKNQMKKMVVVVLMPQRKADSQDRSWGRQCDCPENEKCQRAREVEFKEDIWRRMNKPKSHACG
jgi:hypothetical protein